MAVYCFIFIALAMLAVEHEIRPIQRVNFLLIIIGIFLSLFAGLRDVSVSRDYEPYLATFDAISHGNTSWGGGVLPIAEPGFVYIVMVCYKLFQTNGAVSVMLVFAFLTVGIKMYAIRKLSFNPFLVLLLYYCHYFFFQEMTQIRNGLACSFFFLALISHLRDERLKVFVLILLAILFHNSAILYLLLFFIGKKTLNARLYGTLLLLSVVLGFLRIPLLSIIAAFNLDAITNKLTVYVYLAEKGLTTPIRFFNVLNSINFVLTAYIFVYCVRNKVKDPYLLVFLKCNIIALFMYGLLIDVASMAARFSEIFGAVFPFLFAYLSVLLPFRKFNLAIVICMAAVFLYINLFYGKLLAPYAIMPIK
jgi:hypothetical protein